MGRSKVMPAIQTPVAVPTALGSWWSGRRRTVSSQHLLGVCGLAVYYLIRPGCSFSSSSLGMLRRVPRGGGGGGGGLGMFHCGLGMLRRVPLGTRHARKSSTGDQACSEEFHSGPDMLRRVPLGTRGSNGNQACSEEFHWGPGVPMGTRHAQKSSLGIKPVVEVFPTHIPWFK